jgi:hypothetical protein
MGWRLAVMCAARGVPAFFSDLSRQEGGGDEKRIRRFANPLQIPDG